ncbi:MAG: DNA (cytosine-5-)-methyltransferase [Candidatus Marinimicrobia bacterium]|nr:DNA (cytosine-5-)-methyltransferase [Candidatus Neomarinimicrobiota bacterium]
MDAIKSFNNTSVYKNASQRAYDITDEKRALYRKISHESRIAKLAAEQGLLDSNHKVNTPNFDPDLLIPQLKNNNLTAISLFSGGGGLDLGFSRAGYNHVASYELIPICKDTLSSNLLCGNIFCGPNEGDVTKADWNHYQGKIDIVHGGPPCQPFSIAGAQKGIDDKRNMWGEFSRAVNMIKPKVFIAENVPGILNPKFRDFVKRHIFNQLSDYSITKFEMHTADYGVPQIRKRVFFVGFRKKNNLKKIILPQPTHTWSHLGNQGYTPSLFDDGLAKTGGVRECLGLPNIGFDSLAPTIRSAFTGKRNTTSILNSTAGQKTWGDMQIWPNGVQIDRNKASAFPAKNGHFRLSVQDVGLIQGFPESWKFAGAVYQIIGQIGNSVSPPVAYQVALSVANTLKNA